MQNSRECPRVRSAVGAKGPTRWQTYRHGVLSNTDNLGFTGEAITAGRRRQGLRFSYHLAGRLSCVGDLPVLPS